MVAEAVNADQKQAQRLLRLYHLYRLSVGITLVLLISSNMDNRLLTSANDDLLRGGSWLYLIINMLLVVFLENTRRPAQLFTLALVDVLLLCGLFYAAGGVASALGNLLVVSVAISNTLLRRRIGLLIAAIAAIGIVGLSFLLGQVLRAEGVQRAPRALVRGEPRRRENHCEQGCFVGAGPRRRA